MGICSELEAFESQVGYDSTQSALWAHFLVKVLEWEPTSEDARALPVKNLKYVQVPVWDAAAAGWEMIQDNKSQVITDFSGTQPLT